MDKLLFFALATFLIVDGIKCIVTKKATITQAWEKDDPARPSGSRDTYDESYSGIIAVVIGIGELLGGVVVLFMSVFGK